jgi:MYXO-CTERM domain-containing protein
VRKLAVLALLAASLAVAPRADAYLCTAVPNSNPILSQAWNQRCIPYFISTNGSLLDGEPRRQLLLQSFRVWTTPACTDLSFMDFGYTEQAPGFNPNSDDNQNIVISVESEAESNALFTRGELAITVTSFNTVTGEIFDADIMINAFEFAFEDVASTDECEDKAQQPYDLRNTLVHEIGHLIGFEHDQDESSTMFASAPECETKKRDLTLDNSNGVCTVYGSGQETMTCAAPNTYDKGGDVGRFRNQCDQALIRHSCGCTSTETTGSPGSPGWLIVLAAALMMARRRSSGR